MELVPLDEGVTVVLKAWEIVPEDCNHPYSPDEDTGWVVGSTKADHRLAIDACKKLIEAKKKIRPILVIKKYEGKRKYQRLDGYARYWAYRELGTTEILCQVIERDIPGGQHKLPWVIS